MTDTWSLTVNVVAADAETIRGNLNNRAVGLGILRPIGWPAEDPRRDHAKWARHSGSVTSGPPVDDDGILTLGVRVQGSTWAQMAQRWQTARGWLRLEDDFFLDVIEEGLTTRYRTERPAIARTRYSRVHNWSEYQLQFTVQPNPAVTFPA